MNDEFWSPDLSVEALLQRHQQIVNRLDNSVRNQNDWRFSLFGAYTELGEATAHLPWRPWRVADRRPPYPEEIIAAVPELADAVSAIFRAVVLLGVPNSMFQAALWEHVAIKEQRIDSGKDS